MPRKNGKAGKGKTSQETEITRRAPAAQSHNMEDLRRYEMTRDGEHFLGDGSTESYPPFPDRRN